MAQWDAFYPFVLPDVPGCPNPAVDHALRQAAREFCARTLAWNEYLDPQPTIATLLECEFDLSSDQEIIKILDATIGTPDPVSGTIAWTDLPVWRIDQLPRDWKTNPCLHRGIVTPDRLVFYVVPQQCAGLSVVPRVALKPSNSATCVSDDLFDQYAIDIASGAKALLMLNPDKPYTNLALSQYHRGVFESSCATVAVMVGQSFSQTSRRARPGYF